MNKLMNKFALLVFLVSATLAATAQTIVDSEVPGDNFSLEGALELFKKSASPEEFEKHLNSAGSKVNNLDLNNDGNIDYIRVIDRNEGNVHAFILQAALSDNESQDIAVIELEKLDDGKAVLQITGDADVYGIETIIEPTEEVRVNAGTSTQRAIVNVWAWPSVQYVYSPYYSIWASPWGWAYHPAWWSPWRPIAFQVYSPWWRPYRPYYSLCYSHRIGYLPRLYRPYRTTSVIVYHNHGRQIDHYRSNYNGHDRYTSRSGGRDRYDGYGGRSRSDYNGRRSYDNDNSGRRSNDNNRSSFDNGRRNDSYNSSPSRSNNSNSRGNDQRSRSSIDRSTVSPQRNGGRSSSDFRSTPGRSHSEGVRQNQSGRSFTPSSPQQRQSNVNTGRSQQHSPSNGRGDRSGGGNHGGHQRGR